MKRFLSIILCAAMLFSTFAMCVPAEEYYAGESATTAPTVDGVISEGEYSNTTGAVSVPEGGNGIIVPYTVSNPISNHVIQYYWTYDADYLYLAYKGIGDMNTQLRFYLNPKVESGARDTIRLVMPCSWGELGTTSVQLYSADSTYESGVWSDYVSECASNNWDTGSQNVNEVEVKIKRSALVDANGDVSDVIGVRGFTEHESGNRGEYYWGADPATSVIPYQDIWLYNKAGFHVLNLGKKPETPQVVDGIITDDEYSFTSGKIDTAVTSDIFSAYYPANDIEYTAEFLYDYDDENIYLAYVGERETRSSIRFYIGPKVASGNRETYQFKIDYEWKPFAAGETQAFETENGTISRHTVTRWTADKSSDYAGEPLEWESVVNNVVGGNFDNNSFNINVIEFSIKRSALGNIEDGKIGISAFIDGDASGNTREGIWGINEEGNLPADAVAPYCDGTWSIGSKAGYHIMSISESEVIPEVSGLDARFLTEYGQQVLFVDPDTDVAPVIDGAVSEGEYSSSIESTMDGYGNFNAATGGTWAVDGANYYVSADDECVYIAAEVKDSDHVPYGYFASNAKRADQFIFSLGGIIDTPSPKGIASTIGFYLFDGNAEGTEGDYMEISSGYALSDFVKANSVSHNDETGVTTYELAIKWAGIKSAWSNESERQYQLMTLGAAIQDTSSELITDSDMGHRTGIRNWGITGKVAEKVYTALAAQFDCEDFFGQQNEKTIPHMFFLGTEAEYEAFKAERVGEGGLTSVYSVSVTSNIDGALKISGDKEQIIMSTDPKMSAVSASANLGYVYSHYTVNGVRYEGSTVALENITEDVEIVFCADYATYELPIINIDTNNTAITSKEDYVDMTFDLINCDSELEAVTGGIRLRGNSTMTYPKKPYRIKFDNKQSLFGLEKAKSWVLLAEYLDPSALHNYTAFTLANDMDGMGFNPTPNKVNVYLDGEYIGLYTLCEQVQENTGRIGNEIDVTADMVDLKDFNFFIAMDLSCTSDVGAEEDLTYIKIPIPDYDGDEHEEEYMIIELKYPESDAFVSEDQFISYREQLRVYMTDLLDALATGDAEYLKAELNINSLIDYLLIDQIMDEDDHHFKSFNMYFTNTSDNPAENGKLSFGPVWDYDYSLGVPWQGVPNLHFTVSDRMYFSNIFFRGMMNIPEFAELAAERYEAYMRPAVLSFLEGYDELVASMDESVALNHERWYSDPDKIGNQMNDEYYAKFVELGEALGTMNIEFLKASLENRIELLDATFIDNTNHVYSDSVITKEATCTENGIKTYTCLVCGATKEKTVEATGHTSGAPVRENVINATETANGSYDNVVYCTKCGAEISRTSVVIPATNGDDYPVAVTVDGVISTDEYFFTTGRLDTKADIADVMYLAHNYTSTCTGHKMQYYWDFDSEYIYLAYEGEGDMNSEVVFYLNPNIEAGVRDTIRLGVNCSWGELKSTTVKIYTDDSVYIDVDWSDYVAECASDNWDTGMLNVNVIELKIKRSALSADAFDKLGIRGFTAPESGNAGEVYWGADPEKSVIPYEDIWCYNKAGFHVIPLSHEANYMLDTYGQKHFYVDDATQENTPVGTHVDGVITAGEYNFIAKSDFLDGAASNSAFTVIDGTDSVEGMDLYVTHDADYIYFGVKITDTVPAGTDFVYLNIPVGKSMSNKLMIYLPFYGIGNLRANVEEILSSPPFAAGENCRFVDQAVGSRSSDGYVYEISVKKEELVKYANECDGTAITSIDKIFYNVSLRIQSDDSSTNPYIVYGFKNEALSTQLTPVWQGTYAHVLYLDENSQLCEAHTYNYETLDTPNSRKGICAVCGHVDVETCEHVYGEGVVTAPTCTTNGYTTYTCTVCGGTYVDDIVPATEHLAGEAFRENMINASCGCLITYDNVVCCSICNSEISRETVEIDYMYDPVVENNVPAKCTETGSYDRVVYCSICNDELSREKITVAPLGHDYVDGVCSRCGAISEEYTEGLVFTLNDEGTEYSVTDYTGTATDVVIPATYEGLPVTSIADQAFLNCDEIVSVYIPSSIISIGDSAFSTLYKLETVIFAENSQLTIIGHSAFYQCINLSTIEIPASVTHIGSAFAHSGLESITFEENSKLVSLAESAFEWCDNLVSIELPEGIERIEYRTFRNAMMLSDINIPYSVTSIGEQAFEACYVTSINIPNGVTSIEYWAFHGCSFLEFIYFEGTEDEWNAIEKIAGWDEIAGSNTQKGTYTVVFLGSDECNHEAGTVVKENQTLATCTESASYDRVIYCTVCNIELFRDTIITGALGHTLVQVDEKAATCTKIGWNAYEYCSVCDYTTYEEIPATGHTEGAAATCTTAQTCTVCGDTLVAALGHDYVDGVCSRCETVDFEYYTEGLVFTLNDEGTEYSVTDYTGTATEVVIPATYEGLPVTSIGVSAFSSCTAITSVDLPDSVTSIGENAFNKCESLKEIEIPSNVTLIDDWAFSFCVSLTTITFKDGSLLKTIGNHAFNYCYSLTSLEIPSNVSGIGIGITKGCYGLESLTVDASNKYLYSEGNCVIATSIATLRAGTKNSVIPANGTVKYIGEYAFADNIALTSIEIPASVEGINYWAFYGCDGLTSVTFAENSQLNNIGSLAFYKCNGLTSIELPDGITVISKSAFNQCSELNSITIPDSITYCIL